MVLLCIFFALGILLSLCLFVRKVERSVEISLGMVKMLALSIFRKNAVALKMLSGKFIKEPAKNPAEDTN